MRTDAGAAAGAHERDGRPGGSVRWSITLLALAAFASASAFRVSDPLLPALAADFHVGLPQASSVVTLFAMAYGVSQFVCGPLGDRCDKYRLIRAAALLCAAASLGAAVAPTFAVLQLCRFAAGAAGAAIIPLGMAWVGDHVPYQRRQATLARFALGSVSGLAAGQSLGGIVAAALGWRWVFGLLACLYAAVGLLMWLHRPAAPAAAPPPPITLLQSLRTVGRAGLARWLLLMVLLEGAAVFGCLALLPSLLQQRYGVTMLMSGLTAGLFALGGLAYAVGAPRLVARLGETGLMRAGGVLLGAAFLMFATMASAGWAIPASLVLGLGYYFVHGTLQTRATQLAPAVRGTAVSLFAGFFFCGQSAGVWAVSQIGAAGGLPTLLVVLAGAAPLATWGFSALLRGRGRP